MKSPEEKEDINPFPEDESQLQLIYQDGDNHDKGILNQRRNSKIPIKIVVGGNSFALLAGAGTAEDFKQGTFAGDGFGQNLEEGIKELMSDLKRNATVYLKRTALGMDNGKYQDIAFKLVNHKGNLEDIFFIKYYEGLRDKIEPHLGKYRILERDIVSDAERA